MKLRIISIESEGGLDDEHVVMEAIEDCDLENYVLVTSTNFSVSKRLVNAKAFFDLPEQRVNRGDFVFIYSKSGREEVYENTLNTRTHMFYMGAEGPTWYNDKCCAFLLEVSGTDAVCVGHHPKPKNLPTRRVE